MCAFWNTLYEESVIFLHRFLFREKVKIIRKRSCDGEIDCFFAGILVYGMDCERTEHDYKGNCNRFDYG